MQWTVFDFIFVAVWPGVKLLVQAYRGPTPYSFISPETVGLILDF